LPHLIRLLISMLKTDKVHCVRFSTIYEVMNEYKLCKRDMLQIVDSSIIRNSTEAESKKLYRRKWRSIVLPKLSKIKNLCEIMRDPKVDLAGNSGNIVGTNNITDITLDHHKKCLCVYIYI
jgi:hypothetical protein